MFPKATQGVDNKQVVLNNIGSGLTSKVEKEFGREDEVLWTHQTKIQGNVRKLRFNWLLLEKDGMMKSK